MAPRFFVEVLAKELGHRRVTVNSILPSATEGAGGLDQWTATRGAKANRSQSDAPMHRMRTLKDTADAAEYLASNLEDFVSGQHLLLRRGAAAA